MPKVSSGCATLAPRSFSLLKAWNEPSCTKCRSTQSKVWPSSRVTIAWLSQSLSNKVRGPEGLPAISLSRMQPLKARRIYLLLRERILNGALEPGSRLPGELSIAAEYGVSRVTVRRALDTLAVDDLIDRRPGSGTFVREGNSVQPIVADLSNVLSHLVEMGRRTSVRLLSFAYVNPSESVAGALGLEPGERAQRSIRIRLIDGA